VLNRSDSKVGLTLSDVEKALKLPIGAKIPSSGDVSASINKGVPLVLDQPSHPVSVAIRDLARTQIRGTELSEGKAVHGRGKPRESKLPFLKRRFAS
jgi:pilus assembly protein CpaE